jgi:two-component system sensor histidine kinase UhpB
MAKDSVRPFSGIEIGLFGTFTLRVVQPWWINGEVVGYIQVGEKIDHVVEKLHDVLDVELYVSIYKEFLNRKKWEKGMRQYIGRDPHWNQFSSAVIVNQTLDVIPEIIGRLLEKGHHDYRQVSPDRNLSLSGRRYRYRFLPLDEVSGREVGDLVVLIDVTEQLADLYETILLTGGICFVIGLMMFVFLYQVLGWVERKLRSSQAELIGLGSASRGLVKEGVEWELASEFSSPALVVIVAAISIFIAEFIVMYLLSFLPSPLILHITHRMRVEKELIFEKEKLIKVYESSPDAVVVLDRDCRIEYANKVTETISGIPLSEMKGRRCFEIIIGRNSICDGCMIEEVMKKKKTESKVKHELTVAGIENWLWQIWYPVFNQKGEVENVVEIARDITVQKRAEEELKKTARELRNLSRHQQTIREEERAHIAREIHDELGQLLTATQLELRNLTNKLPWDKKYLREKAGSIAKIIDTGIQTVKKISSDLRPSILDDLGLVPALEDYAGEFQARTGIACELVFDTDGIVPDKNCSTAVFRIFQESFTNVARHARASRITAHMTKENGTLMLQITDNGRGSVKENIVSAESFGLLGMKERAQSVGGGIDINSVEGKGTTITLTVPLSLKGEQPR